MEKFILLAHGTFFREFDNLETACQVGAFMNHMGGNTSINLKNCSITPTCTENEFYNMCAYIVAYKEFFIDNEKTILDYISEHEFCTEKHQKYAKENISIGKFLYNSFSGNGLDNILTTYYNTMK